MSDDKQSPSGTPTILTPEEQTELQQLFADLLNCSRLNDWEIGFMNDIQARFEQYEDKTRISEKQWHHIRKIAATKVYV